MPVDHKGLAAIRQYKTVAPVQYTGVMDAYQEAIDNVNAALADMPNNPAGVAIREAMDALQAIHDESVQVNKLGPHVRPPMVGRPGGPVGPIGPAHPIAPPPSGGSPGTPTHPIAPDQGLPGDRPYPDQGLPGDGGGDEPVFPDQGLPGDDENYPDQGPVDQGLARPDQGLPGQGHGGRPKPPEPSRPRPKGR